MRMMLGEMLLRAKVINERQLQAALAEKEKWGGRLGQILVRMGYLSEDLLVKALSKQLGIPRVDLEKSRPSLIALKMVKLQLAEEHAALPIDLQDGGTTLVVAMADPTNVAALDELKAASGCRKVVTYMAGEQEVLRQIGRHYSSEELREELSAGDEFRLLDTQGKTVNKPLSEVSRGMGGYSAHDPLPSSGSYDHSASSPYSAQDHGPSRGVDDPGTLLKKLEQTQRKEVKALKAIVETLIEKGVFSREEYLSKVGRR